MGYVLVCVSIFVALLIACVIDTVQQWKWNKDYDQAIRMCKEWERRTEYYRNQDILNGKGLWHTKEE